MENKSTSVNKYAVMLKSPTIVFLMHMWEWGIVRTSGGWLPGFIKAQKGSITSLSFLGSESSIPPVPSRAVKNVKGETPPGVTKPSSRQAPERLCGAGGAARGWAELPPGVIAAPGPGSLRGPQASAKQVRAGLAWPPWEEKGLCAALEQGLAPFPCSDRAVLEAALLLNGSAHTWNHSSPEA